MIALLQHKHWISFFDINKAIAGAYYLLKEEGAFIGTVSGISQIIRYDMERWGDYWRFTELSIKMVLEKYFKGNIQIYNYGNVLSSIALLQGIPVEDLPDSSLLDEPDSDYQMTISFIATKWYNMQKKLFSIQLMTLRI